MWTCKHCNVEFDFERNTEKANHSRHCDSNPKKLDSYKNITKSVAKYYDGELGELKEFNVICSACGCDFSVKERESKFPSKSEYFCSRKCANSVGGKAKAKKHHYDEVAHYTTVAWRHHEKKCVVCDERNIVAVHHLNENHNDNRPQNLIPLCPTHHHYVHSRYKYMVEDKINNYLLIKWG